MDFYVPAQASTGLVGPIDNYQLDDGTTDGGIDAVDYRIGSLPNHWFQFTLMIWTHELESKRWISFGEFDAFAGVSLDDGTTWKTTNLSKSADLSFVYFTHYWRSLSWVMYIMLCIR